MRYPKVRCYCNKTLKHVALSLEPGSGCRPREPQRDSQWKLVRQWENCWAWRRGEFLSDYVEGECLENAVTCGNIKDR